MTGVKSTSSPSSPVPNGITHFRYVWNALSPQFLINSVQSPLVASLSFLQSALPSHVSQIPCALQFTEFLQRTHLHMHPSVPVALAASWLVICC